MKHKLIQVLLLVFLSINVQAQGNYSSTDFTKVSDKILMYNYEVSMNEYLLFLKDKNYQSNLLFDKSVFNDTAIFGNQMIPDGFADKYFAVISDFGNYPVVGVTAIQAEEYCKWLTNKLNTQGSYKGKIKEIRLPTLSEYYVTLLKEEMEVVFYPENDSYSKFNRTNSNDPNQYTNLTTIDLTKIITKQGEFNENLSGNMDAYTHLCPTNVYNINGCRSLIGNVSEFVYIKQQGTSIIPIGNNYSGEIRYNGKLSNPFYFAYDESILANKENWYIASAKVGFRFVIVFKD